MKKKEGRTGGSLKVCDERLQQYFQLPWKLFTAHKLPGRNTSLSPSHHPSDKPPSCPNEAGLFFLGGGLFFWKKKERKWNGLLFHSFILLLSFSCFCTFFFSFLFLEEDDSSRWRRATAKPKLRRWRMIYLLPLLHFHPPFFPPPPPLFFLSCAYVGREKDWERRKMRKEEGMKGNKQGRNVVKWAQM